MPHATREASESHCTMSRAQLAHLISSSSSSSSSSSISQPKPTISSILTSHESVHPTLNTTNIKKKKTSTFRGFGCTSSRHVSLPKATNKDNKSKSKSNYNLGCSTPTSIACVDFQHFRHLSLSNSNIIITNGPNSSTGIAHTHHRQRFSPDSFGVVRSSRHVSLPSSRNFPVMMLLRQNLLMGGRYSHCCCYRDEWRLDVDNMSYEQLLALSESIGYVNTGLTENEMRRYIVKFKRSEVDQTSKSEVEKKCSICQEEFEAGEEMGRLSCKHEHHFQCLKQWLAKKNSCPMCKQEVVSRHRHHLAKS